jgi:hypothetical protein
LSGGAISHVLEIIIQAQKDWVDLIDISFLSMEMKEKYRRSLTDRFARLFEQV